jgi:hypothetical protein
MTTKTLGSNTRIWKVFVPHWWLLFRVLAWWIMFWRSDRGRLTIVFIRENAVPVSEELRLRRYRDSVTREQRTIGAGKQDYNDSSKRCSKEE